MRIASNEASEVFKVGEQPFGSILAKNNRCKGAKMIYRGLTHEFDLAFTMEQLPYFSDCLIGSMTILHVKPDF